MATSKGLDNKAELKILGTDNGCQTSLERFTDPHRKAFFGKCNIESLKINKNSFFSFVFTIFASGFDFRVVSACFINN